MLRCSIGFKDYFLIVPTVLPREEVPAVLGVSIGAPQGSASGPVLFLVHVNYFTDGHISNYGAIADDYKFYLHFDRDTGERRAALQRDLNIS